MYCMICHNEIQESEETVDVEIDGIEQGPAHKDCMESLREPLLCRCGEIIGRDEVYIEFAIRRADKVITLERWHPECWNSAVHANEEAMHNGPK